MHLKITSIFVLYCLLIACNQNRLDAEVEQKETVEKLQKEGAGIAKNVALETWREYFTKAELTAISRVKQAFDKGLGDNSKDRGIPYLYEYHSNRMRADYFNKFPYTLNYPYNDKFDLSHVQKEVPVLSRFLTNKCGFQSEENGKIIRYHCFKQEGPFMEMLQALGKDTPLLVSLHQDYFEQKSISKNVRELLIMNSKEALDFENEAHQLIYMFYQILINEERLANNKVLGK